MVLDTNVVLDWLLFADPGIAAVAKAVGSGAVRWLACARMRDEFERTLSYPVLAARVADRAVLLARFDAAAQMVPAPASSALRCSDPDDQVFVDLALAIGASSLVSHDRAVLRLARQAHRLGVRIVKPADWRLD